MSEKLRLVRDPQDPQDPKTREAREISGSMSRHPAGSGIDARELALREAERWAAQLDAARHGYVMALRCCRAVGLSNQSIGDRVGRTEGAIRSFLKRNRKLEP